MEVELAVARGDTAKAIPILENGLTPMLPWPAGAFFLGTDSLARAYLPLKLGHYPGVASTQSASLSSTTSPA